MIPNKGSNSEIPARFILNPDISRENELSSGSDNKIYEVANDNKN